MRRPQPGKRQVPSRCVARRRSQRGGVRPARPMPMQVPSGPSMLNSMSQSQSSRRMLSALRRAGAPYRLSPKQLLQQTLVSSGTMTNRIDRLVERGLVSRQTDPNDGRGILVEMSPAGLTRVDAAITRLVDAEAELLASLPAAEQKRLAGLLRKLSLGFD